ncbi:MAG TPA: ABC transporter ATP-binding protein, partial [Blastocatellia bacterium]|nr:ABC transporter ATP-binding protein [Blastocatellia bacterium]
MSQAQARSSFARLLSYTRSAWRSLTLLCISLIATSLLELAVPWVIGFMIVDRVIRRGQLSELPNIILILTAIFIAQQLFSFLQEYVQELANQKIIHRLRCDLYEHVERLPLKFFERDRTGDLLARITGDVGVVEGLLKTIVNDVASEVIRLVGTI